MVLPENQREELDKTLKNLNLSNAEVDKFSKAFKDPEFLKLFEEYAKEVSDPKNKAETEEYLRQLESEGRAEEVYGKGTTLILPTAVFVLKTRDTTSGQKVFINICTSDKLERLRTHGASSKNGAGKGTYVEMPLTLSNKKIGTDKEGKPAMVWDFVVHPETLAAAAGNPAIHKMMVDTAMENIEGANKGVVLVRNAKVLKTKYKGVDGAPQPHVLTIRSNSPAAAGSGGSKPAESVGGRIKPVPSAPCVPHTAPAEAEGSNTEASRSAFKFPETASKANARRVPQQEPHHPGYKHPNGEMTPEYEVVHSGQVDLSQAWGDAGRGLPLPPTTYPQALVVRVVLPGVTSAAGVELDVSTSRMLVIVPGKFRLDMVLPFRVRDAEGTAKFDKVKSTLQITLPTVAPPPPLVPAEAASGLVREVGGNTDDVDGGHEGQDVEAAASNEAGALEAGDLEHAANVPAGQGTPNSSHVVPSAGAKTELSENQLKWLELHAQQQQAAEAEKVAMAPASASTTSAAARNASCPEAGPDFEASESFTGARAGFYFTRGTQGLGYYHDPGAARPEPVVTSNTKNQALAALTAAGVLAAGNVMMSVQQPLAVHLQPRLTRSLAEELD